MRSLTLPKMGTFKRTCLCELQERDWQKYQTLKRGMISMEARSGLLLLVAMLLLPATSVEAQTPRGRMLGSARAVASTQNFLVYASDQASASKVAEVAEACRHDLAIHWLGQPLNNWPEKCPIIVTAGENLGAGGATTFTLTSNSIQGLHMNVQGSMTRILDSVIPHEVTHTVLASHLSQFGKPVPRWADEGASTTVEHMEERTKHDHFLIQFLSQGRGLPFATMFTLKEYPADIMPLYAQGYSVSAFLIAQGGPKTFIKFLESGMQNDDWVGAVERHYGYSKVGKLQTAWNRWVGDGGGDVVAYSAERLGMTREAIAANGNVNNGASVALVSNDAGVRQASANVPQGRFAVGKADLQNAAMTQASNVRTVPSATRPDPVSLSIGRPQQAAAPVRTASNVGAGSWYHRQLEGGERAADTGAAVVADASDVQNQESAGVNYSSALPQPFQGVGSANSVPLYR